MTQKNRYVSFTGVRIDGATCERAVGMKKQILEGGEVEDLANQDYVTTH
jgi:hypothetical protein